VIKRLWWIWWYWLSTMNYMSLSSSATSSSTALHHDPHHPQHYTSLNPYRHHHHHYYPSTHHVRHPYHHQIYDNFHHFGSSVATSIPNFSSSPAHHPYAIGTTSPGSNFFPSSCSYSSSSPANSNNNSTLSHLNPVDYRTYLSTITSSETPSPRSPSSQSTVIVSRNSTSRNSAVAATSSPSNSESPSTTPPPTVLIERESTSESPLSTSSSRTNPETNSSPIILPLENKQHCSGGGSERLLLPSLTPPQTPSRNLSTTKFAGQRLSFSDSSSQSKFLISPTTSSSSPSVSRSHYSITTNLSKPSHSEGNIIMVNSSMYAFYRSMSTGICFQTLIKRVSTDKNYFFYQRSHCLTAGTHIRNTIVHALFKMWSYVTRISNHTLMFLLRALWTLYACGVMYHTCIWTMMV